MCVHTQSGASNALPAPLPTNPLANLSFGKLSLTLAAWVNTLQEFLMPCSRQSEQMGKHKLL